MNQRRAKLLRKFADKAKLHLPSIKRAFNSTPHTEKAKFCQELQVILSQ